MIDTDDIKPGALLVIEYPDGWPWARRYVEVAEWRPPWAVEDPVEPWWYGTTTDQGHWVVIQPRAMEAHGIVVRKLRDGERVAKQKRFKTAEERLKERIAKRKAKQHIRGK